MYSPAALAATLAGARVHLVCAAPLNYARNYARPDRLSASEMHTVHPVSAWLG